MLIDILTRYCVDTQFSVLCASLIEVGQKGFVDNYLRPAAAADLRTPGRPYAYNRACRNIKNALVVVVVVVVIALLYRLLSSPG